MILRRRKQRFIAVIACIAPFVFSEVVSAQIGFQPPPGVQFRAAPNGNIVRNSSGGALGGSGASGAMVADIDDGASAANGGGVIQFGGPSVDVAVTTRLPGTQVWPVRKKMQHLSFE